MKQCSNCEIQAENNAQFCPNCGAALPVLSINIPVKDKKETVPPTAPYSRNNYRSNHRSAYSMVWYELQTRILFWISIGCRGFSSLGAIVGDGLSIASGYLYFASLVLSLVIRAKLLNRQRIGIYLYWGNLVLMMIADAIFYTYVWEDDLSGMVVMLLLDAAFLVFNILYYRKRRFLFN